jgi:hypothetical protein
MGCEMCDDNKVVILPTGDDVDLFPCPCCQAWPQGFGGLKIKVRGRIHWLILPSAPNECAIYQPRRIK